MPSDLLLRERLNRVAAHVLDARLTWVTAPTGAGKSVLLRQWREALTGHAAVAVLEAEYAHNSPPVVRAALAEAVRDELPTLRWAATDAPTPSDLPDFIRAAEAAARRQPNLPLVIMIDAFEVITDPSVRDVFAASVEMLPSDVHLVFASRVSSPFFISRLRGAGQLVEIDAHDLAFTSDEVGELARQLERSDSSAAAGDVADRSGGWAAAVSLLLRDGRPEQSLRRLIDEDLLPGLPPELLGFLLDTSALEEITLAMADELRESDDSAALLERLERQGSFPVRARDADRWRHPPVVRNHLLGLARARDPERAGALQRRAASLGAAVALSSRELDVLALLDSDLPIAAIAHRLEISYHTAKTHVRSIYAKLAVGTRTAAVRAARNAGLLPG